MPSKCPEMISANGIIYYKELRSTWKQASLRLIILLSIRVKSHSAINNRIPLDWSLFVRCEEKKDSSCRSRCPGRQSSHSYRVRRFSPWTLHVRPAFLLLLFFFWTDHRPFWLSGSSKKGARPWCVRDVLPGNRLLPSNTFTFLCNLYIYSGDKWERKFKVRITVLQNIRGNRADMWPIFPLHSSFEYKHIETPPNCPVFAFLFKPSE